MNYFGVILTFFIIISFSSDAKLRGDDSCLNLILKHEDSKSSLNDMPSLSDSDKKELRKKLTNSTGMEIFEKCNLSASSGDVNSQYMLGNLYNNGVHVEQDKLMALYWFYRASKNGNTDADMSIGNIVLSDANLPEKIRFSEAYYWFFIALRNDNHIEKSLCDFFAKKLSYTEMVNIEEKVKEEIKSNKKYSCINQ